MSGGCACTAPSIGAHRDCAGVPLAPETLSVSPSYPAKMLAELIRMAQAKSVTGAVAGPLLLPEMRNRRLRRAQSAERQHSRCHLTSERSLSCTSSR
jgi:hypothetical protein